MVCVWIIAMRRITFDPARHLSPVAVSAQEEHSRPARMPPPPGLRAGVLAQASRFTKKTGYTLQEDVLIIDVASLVGVSAPLATETFDDCLDYCLNTPGCNSADFCSSASGCGEYCIDHNTRNPALKLE